ncbi:MAG: hypothetical protein EA424_11420 [Planctomycetaceae bacterium]|nr:MAG: hypothetical protein EA424_11420 [Planctomycetaceae bacterium]
MNLAEADKSFLPRDASRPPGSTGQGMGAKSQAALPRKSMSQSELKDRCSTSLPEFAKGWGQASIAELSSSQISEMSRAELVRVVRAARLPSMQIRPEHADRVTLERLAHLARLCCRNRQGASTMTAIEEQNPCDE